MTLKWASIRLSQEASVGVLIGPSSFSTTARARREPLVMVKLLNSTPEPQIET